MLFSLGGGGGGVFCYFSCLIVMFIFYLIINIVWPFHFILAANLAQVGGGI